MWRPTPHDIQRQFSKALSLHVGRETTGLWLMYFNIPSLPELGPSAALLKELWPR